MNNRLYAYQRDKKVLEYIELLGALSTPQIKELVFPKSMRKAQQRMKVLSPKLNRVRPSIDSPYIYYYDKPVQLDHIIMRNWIYIYLTKKYTVTNWRGATDFGILKCDGLCKIKNPLMERWTFIEVEMDSKNKFNKIEKYNKLYEQEGYKGSKLMRSLGDPEKFPQIILYAQAKRKKSQANIFNLSFSLIDDDDLSSISEYKIPVYANLDMVCNSF